MGLNSFWSKLCWWRTQRSTSTEVSPVLSTSISQKLDPHAIIMPSGDAGDVGAYPASETVEVSTSRKAPIDSIQTVRSSETQKLAAPTEAEKASVPPSDLPVKSPFTPRLEKQLSPETIAKIVKAAQAMPAFPTGSSMVMSEINSQDPSPVRIATAVRLDPVLTAVVLRSANSPLFSPSREISNLEAAIITLGMDTLHTVVLHHALAGMIRARSLKGGYDVNALWQHSLASSVYAGALAKKCRNVQVSEAVTAALLHDLGKVVVNVFNGDQVKQILDYKNARLGESLLAREERYVEASHNVYGAVLARHWQLPESLCLAIELHHHTNSHQLPDISPRVKELAAIVFAANQFAKLAGFHGNDMEIDWADSGLLEQIRLPYDIVAAFNAQPANLHNRAKMLVGL